MIYSKDLLEYIIRLDKILEKKMTFVAVGGTAMVLMGLKESTRDVDFCIDNKEDHDIVKNIDIKSGFKIDLFHSGYIFCLQLPEDYIKRARSVKISLKKINLKILSPMDIVITKSSRLNQRDFEDIERIIAKKRIKKERLVSRFEEVKKSWPSSDRVLEDNLRIVLKEFF